MMTVGVPIKERVYKLEVDTLDLPQRAVNVLKRNRCTTIEDVIDNASRLELTKGCGKKTMSDIRKAIFAKQMGMLSPEEQIDVLGRIEKTQEIPA